MQSLGSLESILVYALMFVALVAAIGVVTFRHLFYSALSLASVLVATAGIFIAFHAEFLAAVQILLYVGAVLTLVIFAIMLTERLGEKSVVQNNKQQPLALTGLLLFIWLVSDVLGRTSWPEFQATWTPPTLEVIATALMGPYILPFEVAAIILLATLIGSLVIAKKDNPS